MVDCDEACRAALAQAVCAAISPLSPPSPHAELLLPEHAAPLLRARAPMLLRELGCEDDMARSDSASCHQSRRADVVRAIVVSSSADVVILDEVTAVLCSPGARAASIFRAAALRCCSRVACTLTST